MFPYQRIYDKLKIDIINGKYHPGDLLPSENQLTEINKTARATIRNALAELEKEGYIEKRKGKGSIVKNQRKTLGLLSFRGFTDVLGNGTKAASFFLQSPKLIDWPKNFFYPVNKVEQDKGCFFLERLRSVEDNPVMLERTYLPSTRLTDFDHQPFIDNSLFKTLLIKYGIEIKHLEQDLKAIAAHKNLADILELNEGDPLLHIYRKYYTNDESIFVYSELLCNTQRYFISSWWE